MQLKEKKVPASLDLTIIERGEPKNIAVKSAPHHNRGERLNSWGPGIGGTCSEVDSPRQAGYRRIFWTSLSRIGTQFGHHLRHMGW